MENHNKWYTEELEKYNKSNWFSKWFSGLPSNKYYDDFWSPDQMRLFKLSKIESLENLVSGCMNNTDMVTISDEHSFIFERYV